MLDVALKALELGAVDVILKPANALQATFNDLEEEIISKVKNAATVNMSELRKQARKELRL
ncbi:hypothetical protein KHA80_17625 [Anaerobacillus sp. HL2]|nr:hypothetical protein KHA80_17625 [Anaerobacillus sp. HL2]